MNLDDLPARPDDLRVAKTIDAIQGAFKEMLLEEGFEHITVKALCERARVNKKTFYRYYPAIEYLLAEVQHQYSGAYAAKTRNLRFPKDVRTITRAFLEFSVSQDELYERITCGGPNDRLRQEMVGQVMHDRQGLGSDDAPAGWPTGAWEVYLSLVESMPLHAYQAWVASDKTLPAAQMIDATVAAVSAASSSFERAVLGGSQGARRG